MFVFYWSDYLGSNRARVRILGLALGTTCVIGQGGLMEVWCYVMMHTCHALKCYEHVSVSTGSWCKILATVGIGYFQGLSTYIHSAN